MNYQKELDFAKSLAGEASAIMQRYFRTQEDIGHAWKEDHTPVTIADMAVNRMVIDKIKAVYPDHGVLGEEESYEPERDMIWVVDPIDGTVPFSLGIPTSSFSIALVNKTDGQPVVAVTCDPFLQEVYAATKSGGAFLNDRPIHASDQVELKRSYMCLSSRNGQGQGYSYQAGRMIEDIRGQGAMLLNYMSFVYGANRVASGQFIACVIGVVSPWDLAACALLVQEAGGIVTDLAGRQRRFDVDGDGCILAANKTIHSLLLNKIKVTA